MANGVAVEGRQVLDIIPGTLTQGYVRVIPPGGLIVKYWGYVALEVVAANGARYQVTGRSLWYEGVGLFLGTPFGLDTEVVAYWRESGVPWETAIA